MLNLFIYLHAIFGTSTTKCFFVFSSQYFVQRPRFTGSQQHHCTMNAITCNYLLLTYFKRLRATLFLVPVCQNIQMIPRLHRIQIDLDTHFWIIFGCCQFVKGHFAHSHPFWAILLGTQADPAIPTFKLPGCMSDVSAFETALQCTDVPSGKHTNRY